MSIAERTVRQLVDSFGFSEGRSREAVEAIGDKSDVQMAYNWLLDHGEEDKGGAIEPKHCPHLDLLNLKLISADKLVYNNNCKDGCKSGENWVCLFCGETRCSRYVKSHNKDHYVQTKSAEENVLTVAQVAEGALALGHFAALSLSDLSVWCYECESYIHHPSTIALAKLMERKKFGGMAPPPSKTAKLGDPLQGEYFEVHGQRGKKTWSAPTIARVCDMDARPNYKTCKAHEYLDQEDVLRQKVAMLADMLRESKNCIVYTGAGISTSAGISDYATKATNSLSSNGSSHSTSARTLSPLEARATLSHHVIVALHKAGLVKRWFQQNHDGLPQKAGFPQSHMNEIHGAWFDPSNPVVPMSGTLREDLISDLVSWEEQADLCLALGSSLCGMNADRLAITPAKKATKSKAVGTVIVSLQCTQYDKLCQLRIFAPLDKVMGMLAQEMGLQSGSAGSNFAPQNLSANELSSHVYENLPYDNEGNFSSTTASTLDLRVGSSVLVVRQPHWDEERCGNVGTVTGTTSDGHYTISVGSKARCLGLWWLDEAKAGKLQFIPVVNPRF